MMIGMIIIGLIIIGTRMCYKMIRLINCKDLFSQDFINHVKECIEDYNQGFIIIDDELYLPQQVVVNLDLEYDNTTNSYLLDDMSKTTATDNVSCLFGNHEYITTNEIIDLADMTNNYEFTDIFLFVLDLCIDNYWRGYRNGINV